jgi:hypothetical protein
VTRSWQTYAIGGAAAEKLAVSGIEHDHWLQHAVDIASSRPLCRVKPDSLCWDTSICKDEAPTCPQCLKRLLSIIPKSKHNGTEKEAMAVESYRCSLMQDIFTGIEFSKHPSNPIGVKEAKSEGRWWAGLPLAKMKFTTDGGTVQTTRDQARLAAVADMFQSPTGYLSFNDAAFGGNYTFQELFYALGWLRQNFPDRIAFTVNRAGDCTYFKIKTI